MPPAKKYVTPEVEIVHESAEERYCSAARRKKNLHRSQAEMTPYEHPFVHESRMSRSEIRRHGDNAINLARKLAKKKKWPSKPKDWKRPDLSGQTTFMDSKGLAGRGVVIEIRTCRDGEEFVILKKIFSKKKRDRRIAPFIAVPLYLCDLDATLKKQEKLAKKELTAAKRKKATKA